VPPSRPYTVTGNTKLGYPQTRIMKMPFPGELAILFDLAKRPLIEKFNERIPSLN